MDLFGGLMKGLKPLMEATGVKADEEMQSAILQGEVLELENKKKEALARIGQAAYDMSKAGVWNQEQLTSQCSAVDALEVQLKTKQDELDKAKQIADRKKREEEAKTAARTCQQCGEINSEGTKFCQYCGNKLGIQKPTTNICKKCGADNDLESRFCGECGSMLEVIQPQETQCPGCGTVHPAGTKFCNQCGSRI